MVVHVFAVDMLAWANKLPFKLVDAKSGIEELKNEDENPAQESAAAVAVVRQIVPLQRASYAQSIVPIPQSGKVLNFAQLKGQMKEASRQLDHMMQCANISRQRLTALQQSEKINGVTKVVKSSKAQKDEFVQFEVIRAKKRAEAQKEQILEIIDHINQDHQSSMGIANSRIKDAQEHAQILSAQLSFVEQQNRLQSAKIDYLNELYENECQKVRNLADDNQDSCVLL